jgi:hypothetical protein
MTVAAATELWSMSAIELADVIQSRRASSEEVIEAHSLPANRRSSQRSRFTQSSISPIDGLPARAEVPLSD